MSYDRRDLIAFFLGFLVLAGLGWFGSGGQLWTVAQAQGTVPQTITPPVVTPPVVTPPVETPPPGGGGGGGPSAPGPVGFPCLDALAFHSTRDNNLEVYIMYGDGSGLSRLTYVNPVDEHPAPSPDGRLIAFDSTRDQSNSQIYVMNVDGSNVRRLTFSSAVDRSPNWSLDAQRIAFESNRDGSFQIWTMRYDGSDVRQLTKGPSENHFPAWSKDNTHIAFVSMRDGHNEIYVMNSADGSGQTRLTTTPNNGVSGHPTWSRDSLRIAFESNRTGNYEIFVMNAADGSNLKQITNTKDPSPPKQNRFPYWVPSCDDRIAFSSNRQDPDFRIWITYPDGTTQRRLLYERPGLLVNQNAPDEHAAWSGAPADLPLPLRVAPTATATWTATRVSQLVPGSNSTPVVPPAAIAPQGSTDSTQVSSSSPASDSNLPSDTKTSTGTPSNSGFFGWLISLWNWITRR